jgi:hypothetical protein
LLLGGDEVYRIPFETVPTNPLDGYYIRLGFLGGAFHSSWKSFVSGRNRVPYHISHHSTPASTVLNRGWCSLLSLVSNNQWARRCGSMWYFVFDPPYVTFPVLCDTDGSALPTLDDWPHSFVRSFCWLLASYNTTTT